MSSMRLIYSYILLPSSATLGLFQYEWYAPIMNAHIVYISSSTTGDPGVQLSVNIWWHQYKLSSYRLYLISSANSISVHIVSMLNVSDRDSGRYLYCWWVLEFSARVWVDGFAKDQFGLWSLPANWVIEELCRTNGENVRAISVYRESIPLRAS